MLASTAIIIVLLLNTVRFTYTSKCGQSRHLLCSSLTKFQQNFASLLTIGVKKSFCLILATSTISVVPVLNSASWPSSCVIFSSSGVAGAQVLTKDAGISSLDADAKNLYRQARQSEDDGDLQLAQNQLEQIVVSYPDVAVIWSDLGNVLTTRGNLDQALLCYRKALTLQPGRDSMATILLNKAAIEQAIGRSDDALRDLELAERLSGSTPAITTNKAVALTNDGKWTEACSLFEKVISSSDKNALPWWLRYSMSLLEGDRGTEAVAYLQRTLSRFPDESECKAFATALYTALGSTEEAARYWSLIPENERSQYASGLVRRNERSDTSESSFVQKKLRWGPVAVQSLRSFLQSR